MSPRGRERERERETDRQTDRVGNEGRERESIKTKDFKPQVKARILFTLLVSLHLVKIGGGGHAKAKTRKAIFFFFTAGETFEAIF